MSYVKHMRKQKVNGGVSKRFGALWGISRNEPLKERGLEMDRTSNPNLLPQVISGSPKVIDFETGDFPLWKLPKPNPGNKLRTLSGWDRRDLRRCGPNPKILEFPGYFMKNTGQNFFFF